MNTVLGILALAAIFNFIGWYTNKQFKQGKV